MTSSRNQIESSSVSREYASYADIILAGMNPKAEKKKKKMQLYALSRGKTSSTAISPQDDL